MRCDLLLSRLCLLKTRSQAGKACDEGRVRVNGHPAKPATEIRPGDRLLWTDSLGRFEEQRMVRLGRERIEIVDLAGLRQLAGAM